MAESYPGYSRYPQLSVCKTGRVTLPALKICCVKKEEICKCQGNPSTRITLPPCEQGLTRGMNFKKPFVIDIIGSNVTVRLMLLCLITVAYKNISGSTVCFLNFRAVLVRHVCFHFAQKQWSFPMYTVIFGVCKVVILQSQRTIYQLFSYLFSYL